MLSYCYFAVCYRQMVTRSLLETIRTVENEEEAETFLKAVTTLADDSGDCGLFMLVSSVSLFISMLVMFLLVELTEDGL